MQDQALPVEGTRRKSTLLRDVLIGVAIAALVLVGFLAVKFFILDKDGSDTVAESSTLGNVLIKLPKGVTAELFVDGKHNSTVDDAMKIPVSAGSHRLKLVPTKGEGSCESDVKIAGGKDPTGFDCKLVGDATKPSSDDAKPATDTKTDAKTDTKTDAKADAKTDTKTDAKTDAKTDTKSTTAKTDTKTTTATIDPKTDKTVAKTDPAHPTTTKTTAPDTKVKTPDPHAKDKLPPEDKAPLPPTDSSAAPKGFLQVYSKPTAKILVDGVDTGMSTPISGKSLQLTPGKHKITFVIGDDRFTYSQTIKSGVSDTMSKDLQ